MKKTISSVLLTAIAILMVGCAGVRHASFKISEDGAASHSDSNFSLLQPSVEPQEMAEAEATIITARAQADLSKALAKQIEQQVGQGQPVVTAGHYIGFIINDDPRQTAYVPHPEINQRVKIPAGSYAVLSTSNIPDRITIYDAWGDYTVVATHKKAGVYNGIRYDYGVRIYKVR